jgi:hypothetical protein
MAQGRVRSGETMANTKETKEVKEGPRSFIHQFSEMREGRFAHDASVNPFHSEVRHEQEH